ncbi:plasmid stabilization protein [Wenjunlia vitaminophila]|uniref:Plasmid stabilization protein n=2 Tax=Wenjunlia vitaminophila TaxID=76728 RepID=A0A0T6LPS9_WENVI|nr:right-handed parallel beta-helix repeat-containing protein [Wenjunlia vitaminophila]KRV48119.1 plasmid stabilization protein [Wenjunlia vitaminophila]
MTYRTGGRRSRPLRVAALAAAAFLALSGCGSTENDGEREPSGPPTVLRVPDGYPSIQQAVDVARPGDVVLISSGVYHESVTVSRPRVVLRGADRDKTVIDGEFRRANGITVTGAASVVENLTVRNHLANGVLFTGVTDERLQAGAGGSDSYDPLDTVKFPPLKGFRASYVTAYNNALYGIYAFDARSGVIEHSYASGQSDSGIYVGQCDPCDTVVRHNTLEHNAIGIEVTNASRDLYFLANTAHRNRVGLTINSNNLEALGPQHEAVVIGNTITDNNDDRSPEQADGGFGIGIGIGGGTRNRVERNRIDGHRVAALVLRDVQGYPVRGNSIRDNAVGGGTGFVLAAARTGGNCFTGGGPAPTSPRSLPSAVTSCPGRDVPLSAPGTTAQVAVPPGVSFKQVAAPPPQRQMPGARTAAARPATGLPGPVDLARYRLPAPSSS